MNRSALQNYYPGQLLDDGRSESVSDKCQNRELTLKQLYRENSDLRVKNELLEQSLRDSNNGLLSDERIWNEYQMLKTKVESQQRLIDSQNDMLDEAQRLLQQLKNEKDSYEQELQTLKENINKNRDNYIAPFVDQLNESRAREQQSASEVIQLRQLIEDYQNQIRNVPSCPVVYEPTLETVEEVPEDIENSIVHDENDLLLSWIEKLELLIFMSNDSSIALCDRMDRITVWCTDAIKSLKMPQKRPVKTSLLESPYITLIQSEIDDVMIQIMGNIQAPSPIKQLHTIQNTLSMLLKRMKVKKLVDLLVDDGSDKSSIQTILDDVVDQLNYCISTYDMQWSYQKSDVNRIDDLGNKLNSTIKQFINCVSAVIDQKCSSINSASKLNNEKSQIIGILEAKSKGFLSIISSQKKEVSELIDINKSLLEECDKVSHDKQLLSDDNCNKCERLEAKCKRLQEKYRRAINELMTRGELIRQLQQSRS